MKIFEHRFSSTQSGPVFHNAYIGETLSVIYAPFYVRDKVYDAILNQAVSAVLPDGFDAENGFRSGIVPDCTMW